MKPELEEYSILKLIKDIDNDMLICGESTREIPIVYKKEQVKACIDWYFEYYDMPDLFWRENKEYQSELKELGMWEEFVDGTLNRTCKIDVYNMWLKEKAFNELYKEDNK